MATFLRRLQYEGGPPPSVDWWLTRVNATSKPAMRYWDGRQWSIGIPADASAQVIAMRQQLVVNKAAFQADTIRWTRFKPQWWLTATASKRRSKA